MNQPLVAFGQLSLGCNPLHMMHLCSLRHPGGHWLPLFHAKQTLLAEDDRWGARKGCAAGGVRVADVVTVVVVDVCVG